MFKLLVVALVVTFVLHLYLYDVHMLALFESCIRCESCFLVVLMSALQRRRKPESGKPQYIHAYIDARHHVPRSIYYNYNKNYLLVGMHMPYKTET